MKFTNDLLEATIYKRYKRFLADIELKEQNHLHPIKKLTAYICNTGSMRTCWEPFQNILVSYHDNPKRKLKYQVELIHNGLTWIGINTGLSNKIVIEAIKNNEILELNAYEFLKPEIKSDKSRLDILLYNGDIKKLKESPQDFCYVEIKNVTLKEKEGIASFPDSVTERGFKHLEELISLKEKGYRAVLFYLIQREDIEIFTPAFHIDLKYSLKLKEAVEKGVEVFAYKCSLNPKEIKIDKKVPIYFELDT